VATKPLSELSFGPADNAGQPLNVCIVSNEFIGPIKNGGLGTATSALAKHLVDDGHRVTLLYTNVGTGKPNTGDRPWQHWIDELAADEICLEHVRHDGRYYNWRVISWLVKDFLGQNDFHVVYFNDYFGSGYYALLAKRAGLAPFCNQLHCVITHASTEWIFNHSDHYVSWRAELEWMGLERRSVELADVVIAPSGYLLREYESYGWRLPAQTFQQPYPLLRDFPKSGSSRRLPIDELVFFGRLEVRKGLWLFCESLDRLAERFPRTEVTFLGKVTENSGISSALQIVNRSANWPFRVRLLTDFDQEQALAYLRSPGKLAVMPSIADNSPCVVYECIEAGIPFVSTRGSGADELVDPEYWDDLMVQPTVQSLTEKLAFILENGARFSRPRFDPEQNLATWSAWHRYVAENRSNLIQTSSAVGAIVKNPPIAGSAKAALIVVIDSGACALSLLIENLGSHIERFGDRAAYLLLSSRRGELQEILFEMFSGAPLCILDPQSIDEARQLICASAFAFFVDAETEILTPFFVLALNTLRQQESAVVSCAVAVRGDREESGEIEGLPTGDIPGLAALGEPIGGSVWAVSAASLAKYLSSLELYDAQLDALAPSSSLGQLLMLRCRMNGTPVHVLPIVGAVETQKPGAARRHTGVNETRRFAAELDIVPSVYRGGAAWLAISGFGAHLEPRALAPIENVEFLPPEHPLSFVTTRSEEVDLPEWAAALGRPDLSLQLEAAKGPSPGRVRCLVDLAIRALRSRPTWDLTDLLNDRAVEFGLTPVPKRVEASKALTPSKGAASGGKRPNRISMGQGKEPGVNSPGSLRFDGGRIYVDARRLRIRRNQIQSLANLRMGGPGKIFFFDIPLCGHSTLLARMRSNGSSDPIFLRMKALDQRLGEEMGSASARLLADKSTELSIPLHGIYGQMAIVLEFSGAEKMKVTAESLQVA
jgi:glycosyltransferase involved in cell wall biosynthesis